MGRIEVRSPSWQVRQESDGNEQRTEQKSYAQPVCGGERRGVSELVDEKEGGFRNWGKIVAKQQPG